VVASVSWAIAGARYCTIFGTNTAGQMVKATMDAAPESTYVFYAYGAILGGYNNWQLNGPMATPEDESSSLAVYSLGVEKTIGRLFELKGGPEDLIYLGDGWTAVSGYTKRVPITGEGPYTYTRMYGIKAGNLYSLRRNGSSPNFWTATLIDDSGDWYMVQFISPDVAVALRRVSVTA